MAEVEQVTTPQPEVHSVDLQDEGSLVDDVIFGGEKGSVAEAFEGTDEVEQAIAEPEAVPQQEANVEVPQDNDKVRFQYWQSQADKMKNERDQLQQQFNHLATQQQPAQVETEPVEEAEPEFPAPPEKPQKPYNFSMDEALSDPSSESAKFVQSEQGWRDQMDEYKNLQFEYQMAMMQDEREKIRTERQNDIQRRDAETKQAEQINGIRSQVMDQFKVDSQVADDFVRVMSDPSSISLDNLWKLYASDKGYSSPQAPANKPSGDFQQVKRAQQVPASMGVMPSQTGQNEDSVEDKIIDSMITDYNKQNPWS
jgi:small-conductance mechanosensitive channel